MRSTIARIRARDNVLIAGVKQDFKPFGFVQDDGSLVGFDIDIIQAMADIWNVDVELVPVTSANRIDKLMAGEVDIVAASMTHTRPRDADIDYSQTYFLDGQSLLVAKDSGIEDLAGSAGRNVAAVEGSTSIEQIQQYAEQENVPLTVAPFADYAAALTAIKAGEVDALTTDRAFLLQTAQDNPEFAVVGARFTQEPYGIGVRSGDSYFRNLVDFTLQELYRNGIYNEIFNRWFPGEEPYQVQLLPGEWPYTFASTPNSWLPPNSTRMAEIVQRRQLVVGVPYDFPPFGYLDESNEVVGFDIDIAREFVRRWLGDPEAVGSVRVTAGSRIPALENGEVDLLISSMSHLQQWDDTIDFSQTYFVDSQSLLTTRDSGIRSFEDLNDRTIAAVSGSAAMLNLMALIEGGDLTAEVIPFQEYTAAARALDAEYVDAMVGGRAAHSAFADDDRQLIVVGENLSDQPYGVGMPNFDAGFRDLVNFTLQEMKLDGAFDSIHAKWFGNAAPYPIELWPGSSPRSSSIRLSNIAASSAITPQPAPTSSGESSAVTPTPGPTIAATATPTPVPGSAVTALPTPTPRSVTNADSAESGDANRSQQTIPASGLFVTIPNDYGVFARTSTSTDSESVTLLPNGTLHEALAQTTDGNWIQVQLEKGKTAWVFSGVIDIDAEILENLPAVVVNDAGETVATEPPSPTPTSPVTVPTAEGSVYIVQRGDYLASIAGRYYGDLQLWPIIYEANRDLVGPDPGIIEVGYELIIPPAP